MMMGGGKGGYMVIWHGSEVGEEEWIYDNMAWE